MTGKKQHHLFWQVHPIREESIFKSVLLCQFICFISIFSSYYLGLFYGFTAFIILVISLNKYFFKTSYILDDEVVSIKTWLMTITKRWGYFKRFVILEKHIQLSPLGRPSRLDQFQALTLQLPNQIIKPEVESLVRLKLGKNHD